MSTPYADADNIGAPSRPPLTAVLRSRPYLLLWTAQFASLVAGFFNYVAVAWLTLQLTGSNLAVGSVLAAASVPQAIFMVLGGAVSDRFSARATMLVAGAVRGLATGLVAILTLAHSVQMWQVFAAAVLVGSTTAFFVPAGTSLLPRLVADEQLEAGNALMNLSRTAAMVLGSAAAGVVVAAAGPGPALAVDAGASLLAALLVLPLPRGRAAAVAGSPLGDVRDGILYVLSDIPLRTTLLVVAVLNLFALGAIEVGLPALAHGRFSQGAAALGSAFGAWGLGSTAGSIAAGARPIRRRFGWLMVAVVGLVGAGIAAAGMAPTLPALLAVMVAMGIVEGGGTTYILSWLQRRTDAGMQGRVMALAMLSSVGLEPVALALAGALAERDLSLLFLGSAIAVELTALLTALSRSVRRL